MAIDILAGTAWKKAFAHKAIGKPSRNVLVDNIGVGSLEDNNNNCHRLSSAGNQSYVFLCAGQAAF